MARRGQVDVVVEEFDDRHRTAEARLLRCGAGAVEGTPGVEDRGAHGLPVEAAAAVRGERARVGEQHLGLRGLGRDGGLAEHPQVQGDVVRWCRARREGDHGAQGAAAQQIGADAAARATGGGGRHQEDGKDTYTPYVATEGKPYLLKVISKSAKDPGTVTFSDFNEPVPAEAPKGKVIDLDELGG
jgi:hypothetical protein